MQKYYDCVIFDLGNVLLGFDYNLSVKKLQEKTDSDLNEVYDLFFDSELTHLHDEGKITSIGFYRKIKSELNLNLSFKEFTDIWNNIFFENKNVVKLVKKVRKNYKTMLLSNTNKLHFEYIKNKFDIIKEFDEIIVSYKVHALKPDPAIYRLAIKKARTKPQRIFYTDDRIDLIDGAKTHGIDANLFENARNLEKILIQKKII